MGLSLSPSTYHDRSPESFTDPGSFSTHVEEDVSRNTVSTGHSLPPEFFARQSRPSMPERIGALSANDVRQALVMSALVASVEVDSSVRRSSSPHFPNAHEKNVLPGAQDIHQGLEDLFRQHMPDELGEDYKGLGNFTEKFLSLPDDERRKLLRYALHGESGSELTWGEGIAAYSDGAVTLGKSGESPTLLVRWEPSRDGDGQELQNLLSNGSKPDNSRPIAFTGDPIPPRTASRGHGGGGGDGGPPTVPFIMGDVLHSEVEPGAPLRTTPDARPHSPAQPLIELSHAVTQQRGGSNADALPVIPDPIIAASAVESPASEQLSPEVIAAPEQAEEVSVQEVPQNKIVLPEGWTAEMLVLSNVVNMALSKEGAIWTKSMRSLVKVTMKTLVAFSKQEMQRDPNTHTRMVRRMLGSFATSGYRMRRHYKRVLRNILDEERYYNPAFVLSRQPENKHHRDKRVRNSRFGLTVLEHAQMRAPAHDIDAALARRPEESVSQPAPTMVRDGELEFPPKDYLLPDQTNPSNIAYIHKGGFNGTSAVSGSNSMNYGRPAASPEMPSALPDWAKVPPIDLNAESPARAAAEYQAAQAGKELHKDAQGNMRIGRQPGGLRDVRAMRRGVHYGTQVA